MEVYNAVTLPELFAPGEYGLSSAVNWVTSGERWAGGIQFDADCTEVAVTIMECISGTPTPIPSKFATWNHLTRGARSFDIYDRVDCSPADGTWYEVAQTKALRALTNSGPTQLERTFWTGAVGVTGGAGPRNYPNLTSIGPIYDSTNRILLQPSSTIISGAPLDVVEGLGALEEALGNCYDGAGVIHVPVRVGVELCARYLVYKQGDKLYTWLGNQVVIGRGYPSNFGPNGSVPPVGSTWMFATSPIFGFKGQPRTFQPRDSLDRSVNTLLMIAEQKFLLGWTCCLAGVLVTTGGEQAGDPLSPLQDT